MSESLTNMEAVKPKGPKIFVAMLLIAALGGVAWFFLGREPGPVGAPEEPTSILLVGADDPATPLLEQMGFAVEQRELAQAAADGRSAGATTQDDIEAALYYADTKGYGYVAFADASALDFGSRAVTPDSATIGKHHRYAVFSVGDLAPEATKVTVDPNPKRYALPRHAELVRALFEQDKLAATLVGENNLSIEAQPLYEHVKAAVELKGAFGLVEQKAVSAEKRLTEYVVESEEAKPKPELLAKDVERTHGYALGNGTALLLVDAPVLQDPTTDRVALQWTQDTRAWTQDLTSGARTRCEAADRLRPSEVAVHAGGNTLLGRWGTRELMVFTVDPKQPGCSLVPAGTIARGEGPWGRANAAGKVTRAAEVDGSLVAEIHTPDSPHAQTWPLPGCTAVSSPVWLDDTHIATVCEYEPPYPAYDALPEDDGSTDTNSVGEPAPPPIPEQRWLYLLSIEDGSVLAALLDEDARTNPDVWLKPGGSSLVLLTDSRRGVTTHTFASGVTELFAQPPVDTERTQPAFVLDPALGVRALRTDALTSTPIALQEAGSRFVLSPGGERIVFSVDRTGEFDRNLAVHEFASGTTRRIAINEWARHEEPTFAPDGRTIVFNSTYSTADYGRATVTQAVTLPGS
ncbi:MAG: hypothetical protein ACRBBM_09780 [Pseudomonadaceae bacterium]